MTKLALATYLKDQQVNTVLSNCSGQANMHSFSASRNGGSLGYQTMAFATSGGPTESNLDGLSRLSNKTLPLQLILPCCQSPFILGKGHRGKYRVQMRLLIIHMFSCNYEAPGFHCLFLQVAKVIYNDGLSQEFLCRLVLPLGCFSFGATMLSSISGTSISALD